MDGTYFNQSSIPQLDYSPSSPHLALNSHCLFILLPEIKCENCPLLTIFQKKKKKEEDLGKDSEEIPNMEILLRDDSIGVMTLPWSQTAYRPGAGEGFPNTQRGALQRGAGALLWLNQRAQESGMASRQTPAQECRVSIDAVIECSPAPQLVSTKTYAGRNYGLSC